MDINNNHEIMRCQERFILEDHELMEKTLIGGQPLVRNFSIIAHVDHGKSTLSDRFLQYCGNRKTHSIHGEDAQSLDTLNVERQRGITVKAQGATMFYERPENIYMLNLIDTPGHVDFSYEVSRSLSASQGALLLIDASQGIEAQTIATYEQAVLADIEVIPVLTKMDLPLAQPELQIDELKQICGIPAENVLTTSAKTGEGVVPIFEGIVDRIPPPSGNPKEAPICLLYDSWYDAQKGVIILIHVINGKIRTGDTIGFLERGKNYIVHECGITCPHLITRDEIPCGHVGYVVCNIKDPKGIFLGDTIHLVQNRTVVPKKGYREKDILPITLRDDIKPLQKLSEAKHMVYAGLYPLSVGDIDKLTETLNKLLLNDASVSVQKITCEALGTGFRCGF
eukprot:UN04998